MSVEEFALIAIKINYFILFFQACICPNRVLVQDKVYDEFASKLAEAADQRLIVGNGLKAESTQGPLINEKAVDKVVKVFSLF